MRKNGRGVFLGIFISAVIIILLAFFFVWRVYENRQNPFRWRMVRKYCKPEELSRFVTDHSEELGALVEEIYQAYVEDGEVWIYLAEDYWEEYGQSFPVAEALIRENAIQSISARETVRDDGKETFWLQLEFSANMKTENDLTYSHVGIYYAEDGEPVPWEAEMEGQNSFEEADGTYIQSRIWSGAELYRTKSITENWYYFLSNINN